MLVNNLSCLCSFLPNRSQYINNSSPRVSVSTRARGGLLSPVLHTMYTHSCRTVSAFKYEDDTDFVSLISTVEIDCRSDVNKLVSWCVANCVELNVIKTKEIVIDFRSFQPGQHSCMGKIDKLCIFTIKRVQQSMTN